jgi:diguanylate cyclase (GGDEF)-like protein/PAS domain S-box-containing protein
MTNDIHTSKRSAPCASDAKANHSRETKQQSKRTPIRLLFVEDSQSDVELELRELTREGFEVIWDRVESEVALREALSSSLAPHAVLSDFAMPLFDGMQALEIARELAPQIPFIFVSGAIGEDRAIEAMYRGATDYVLKGNLQRLPSCVRRAVEHASERERIRAIEVERARLVEILEATSDLVGMADPSGKLIYLNAAGRSLLGLSKDNFAGSSIGQFHPPLARDLVLGVGLATAAQTGLWHGEVTMLGAGGTEIPVSQLIIAHRKPGGEVRFYSTIARDIRDRKAYEASIEQFANYDALTGLPNRRLLADRAAQAITRARRANQPCALLVVDIDRFGSINEGYGHKTGDALLRIVADRMRYTLSEGDTLARLGDDAFAVVSSDLAREDDAVVLVQRVRESLRATLRVAGHDLHITVTIGASTYPRDGESFDLLLRNAVAAKYRAKDQGPDSYQFYLPEMNERAVRRLELEASLRGALERNEFVLLYQPKVDLSSGAISGFEALLRWRDREHGLIQPSEFIPVLEDTGLIVPVGEWIVRTVCEQIKSWTSQGIAPRPIAINLSARQFQQKDLDAFVKSIISETGVDPDFLEFELTESLVMTDAEGATRTLQRLKSCGVRLAIDDFGTGYSSLAYLRRFPVDALKIDRAFIRDVPGRAEDVAITLAIINLAHTLKFKVVAEGVETEEQLRFLRSHGCDEMQGYYFARPLTVADSTKALTEDRRCAIPPLASA